MTDAILFTSDFVYPEDPSAFGAFVYDLRGITPSRSLFKLIPIKPGLYMTVYDQSNFHIQEMAFEVRNAPVIFSFLISGSGTNRLRGFQSRKKTEFNIGPATNGIGSFPDVTGDMKFGTDTPVICVDLKIDRRLLATYLEDSMDLLPRELRTMLSPGSQFFYSIPLDREMMATARQILHPPPYKDAALDLFYESRALDLLARQISILTHPGSAFASMGPDDPDLERIRYARNLLVADLKNPPTIAALSRQCGVNEFKLKKGFKQVFNTTIFSHLQQVKMEKAWHLLQQGSCSVTETAGELGYTNISHFCAAFRKQFSINPGALKKARALNHLPIPEEPCTCCACQH